MLMFSYLMATGITTGAFYALVALGIVIVYKSTEVVNLAHGELFMVGGMLAYTCYVMAGMHYLLSLLLAVGGAFVVGILMIMSQQLVVLLAAVVVMAGFAVFFKRTRAGKWMQATASNPKAALLCGLRIDRIYMYTFAVGAAVAGAAGVLMAPLTLLYPDVGFVLFIKGLAAAVLGGITSVPGAVVGGLLLGLIEQMAAGYVHSSIQDVVAFLVIMFALSFLPTGLLGVRGARKI